MKKSKKIEALQRENESLRDTIRELIIEKNAFQLQLFKVREIVNARQPPDPAGELGVIGGNACDHLAIYTGGAWKQLYQDGANTNE